MAAANKYGFRPCRNNAFFSSQYHHIPLIHAGRYYESFYSSAPRKPPMCLQYAIWALGSFGHARFDGHSDIFYRRARQYLEMDEMRVSALLLVGLSCWLAMLTFLVDFPC